MNGPVSADVVVIGGGINGMATAYFMARRKLGRIVVLEARQAAHGASGRGVGILRTYYANAEESRLAIESLEFYRDWNRRIGGDCGYSASGFLWLGAPEASPEITANVARLCAQGARIETVSASRLAEMQPHMSVDGIGIAAFEPFAGYGDPKRATLALRSAAENLGVQIAEGSRATEILLRGGRVHAVKCADGTVETPCVVLAAGAWSAKLAGTAGLAIPLQAIRMTTGLVRHAPFPTSPMTFIDTVGDTFYRPTDERGLGYVSLRDARHNTEVDPKKFDGNEPIEAFAAKGAIERLKARVRLQDARLERAWSAIDGVTPDRRGIYGGTRIGGLYLCVGGSYKGFKTAPAVGRHLAAEIAGSGDEDGALSAFALARFSGTGGADAPGRYSLGDVG